MHNGATIRNTGTLYALVIHTGPDSKLIQNLGVYSTKYSTLDNNINFIFVLVLSFLAFLCTFGAVANYFLDL